MPSTTRHPARSASNLPADPRPPTLREQVHRALNDHTTRMVRDGIGGVDTLKERGLRELKRRGITGMEDVCDSAADLVKKALLRGISK